MFRKQGTRVQLGLEDIEEFERVMTEMLESQQMQQEQMYQHQQQPMGNLDFLQQPQQSIPFRQQPQLDSFQQQQPTSFQPTFGNSYQSVEQRIGFAQQQPRRNN